MNNKKQNVRRTYIHRQTSLPYTHRDTEGFESEAKTGIFDINYIFDKFPKKHTLPYDTLNVKKSQRQSTRMVSHPATVTLSNRNYSEIEMVNCPSSNKTESKRPSSQLLFRKDNREESIHSRKASSRKSASLHHKSSSPFHENMSQFMAKERVKDKILEGNALIQIVRTSALNLNKKLEGKHLTYALSHQSSREAGNSNSSRTAPMSQRLKSQNWRQNRTSNQSRNKNYRPWSPVGDYQIGDQTLPYFISTHH